MMHGQKNIKLSDILSCFTLCSSKMKWPTNKRQEIPYRRTQYAANFIAQNPATKKKYMYIRTLCTMGEFSVKE